MVLDVTIDAAENATTLANINASIMSFPKLCWQFPSQAIHQL